MARLGFVLAGATFGVVINAVYFVGWRFGDLLLEFLPDIRIGGSMLISSQNVFVSFVAAIVGAYVGLWTIGKVKITSPIEGLAVGLLVFAISVPVSVLLLFILYWIYAIPIEFFWLYANSSIVPTVIENAAGSLSGGFFGGVLVLRAAPKFCPKCGAKLAAGIVYCSNCGWGRS